MNKYFLYARKSTDGGKAILSIKAQIFELKKNMPKRGLNIVQEFVEVKRLTAGKILIK